MIFARGLPATIAIGLYDAGKAVEAMQLTF
jgi:hypothetical protein